VPSGPVIRTVSAPMLDSAVSWNVRSGQHSRSAIIRSAVKDVATTLCSIGLGFKTAPELDQQAGGTPPAVFDNDVSELRSLVDRFTRQPRDFR